MLLDDLAVKYGTDKGIWGYLPHYTRELEHRRHDVEYVLEIGICGERDIPNNVTGASLWMWHDYFPNAQIFGIDIDAKWMVNESRISSFVGDQGNPESLAAIAAHGGQYDLIVDDAVHDPEIQLTALRALLPFLKPDGLYVIEDVCPYKLAGSDITLMTSQIPEGYSCEVIRTHKPEVLLFIKKKIVHRDIKPENMIPKPLLGLVMIVKDEAANIRASLESIKPFIDYWTILDTGSTDGTQEAILEILSDQPGELFKEPFIDFAASRNRALDLHGDRTVFTFMPNTDVLVDGGKLRSFVEERRNDTTNAYNMRIVPGHYSLPLVLRTGTGWRYQWRTHEVPMGPGVIGTIPDVILMRDRSERTHEQWRSRWERDRELLLLHIEEDVKDARAWFYLGQTHECLGDYRAASDAYRIRAKLGGYFDETFEAKLRYAHMLVKLKAEPSWISPAYLDAYAFDPRRAEALYGLADHWHKRDNHALAFLFAQRAAELPVPQIDFFIDDDVYASKAADIAAIHAYYLSDVSARAAGRKFAEQCVRAKPNDERIRANRAFYAPSAFEMFAGYGTVLIGFQPEEPWSSSNPSIFFDGSWRCIVRTVNYKIINGQYIMPPDDGAIRTRNFMLELRDDLSVKHTVEMIDDTGIPRSSYPVHGFEDCRLFKRDGKLCFTATVCDFDLDQPDKGPREIVLGELDNNYAIVGATPLCGPWSDRAQKNWMPTVDHDRIIYALSPNGRQQATVFEIDRFRTIYPWRGTDSYDHGRLRGGSQLVHVPEGWLCIVHDVAFPGNGRIYLHRFVLLSVDYKIIGMTDPFYFEHKGIEFCAGLAYDGKRLVASYGVEDRAARLGVFDLDVVRAKLRADYQI